MGVNENNNNNAGSGSGGTVPQEQTNTAESSEESSGTLDLIQDQLEDLAANIAVIKQTVQDIKSRTNNEGDGILAVSNNVRTINNNVTSIVAKISTIFSNIVPSETDTDSTSILGMIRTLVSGVGNGAPGENVFSRLSSLATLITNFQTSLGNISLTEIQTNLANIQTYALGLRQDSATSLAVIDTKTTEITNRLNALLTQCVTEAVNATKASATVQTINLSITEALDSFEQVAGCYELMRDQVIAMTQQSQNNVAMTESMTSMYTQLQDSFSKHLYNHEKLGLVELIATGTNSVVNVLNIGAFLANAIAKSKKKVVF